MRLYIFLSSHQGLCQFSPWFFCKAHARDVAVTPAELLCLIKQEAEHVREMGIVEGQYRYVRQGCLHKCGNRRGCLSMTVCQSRDSCLQLSQLSQEGLLMVQAAEHAPSRVCTLSHHARFLWTRVSVATLDAVIGK